MSCTPLSQCVKLLLFALQVQRGITHPVSQSVNHHWRRRRPRQSSINIGGLGMKEASAAMCELSIIGWWASESTWQQLLDRIEWIWMWLMDRFSRNSKSSGSEHEMYHSSRKWHERKSFIGGRGGPAEDEASSWEIRVSCSFYSRTTRVLIQIYSSSNRERDDRLRHGRWSAPFNWHQALEFCRPPL